MQRNDFAHSLGIPSKNHENLELNSTGHLKQKRLEVGVTVEKFGHEWGAAGGG